jgi:hypothetical protein
LSWFIDSITAYLSLYNDFIIANANTTVIVDISKYYLI